MPIADLTIKNNNSNTIKHSHICQLKRNSKRELFGFNLVRYANLPGHFVSAIEEQSIAEKAGLKHTDRIIEINSKNVEQLDYESLVNIFKSIDNQMYITVERSFDGQEISINNNESTNQAKPSPLPKTVPVSQTAHEASEPSSSNDGQDHNTKPSISVNKTSKNDLQSLVHLRPRLCHLVCRSKEEGYGFHLYSKANFNGHFIGRIDDDSPAGNSGLMLGDRLIEVNGLNIEGVRHDFLIDMLRRSALRQSKLLVVDEETYNLYKNAEKPIHSRLPEVVTAKPLGQISTKISLVGNLVAGNSRSSMSSNTSTLRNSSSFTGSIQKQEDARKPISKAIKPNSASNGIGNNGGDNDEDNNNNHNHNEDDDENYSGLQINFTLKNQSNDKTKATGDNIELKSIVNGNHANSVNSSSSKPIIETSQQPPAVNDIIFYNAPRPRLCHIRKTSSSKCFGFSVRTYKQSGAKYIVELEPGSPAADVGLRNWDRIVEVNGINITNENAMQVSARIDASKDEVRLLVLEDCEYDWYQKHALVPKSSQQLVIYLTNRFKSMTETLALDVQDARKTIAEKGLEEAKLKDSTNNSFADKVAIFNQL